MDTWGLWGWAAVEICHCRVLVDIFVHLDNCDLLNKESASCLTSFSILLIHSM